jgi:hypothetical protein
LTETAAALLGVVLGAIVSFLLSLAHTRIQRRSQREDEVWVRILNSYQDFTHFARQFLRFRDSAQKELWQLSVAGMNKAIHDAEALDPHGATRVAEMREIGNALMKDSPIDEAAAEALERRIQQVFDDYRNDERTKYPRHG